MKAHEFHVHVIRCRFVVNISFKLYKKTTIKSPLY